MDQTKNTRGMGEGTEVTISRLRKGEPEVSTGDSGYEWLLRSLTLLRGKLLRQRGVKGPRHHGATEETRPREHGVPLLQKRKLYLSLGILGSIAVVLFTLLGMLAYRSMVSERELLLQNALLQGYWIARSLEISHRVATQDHEVIMRIQLRCPAISSKVAWLSLPRMGAT